MTTDEKLAAILAAVQTDPGGRGLARHADDNLFTATAGDFQRACIGFVYTLRPTWLEIFTGFYIPTGTPPAFETDGPMGCIFLMQTFADCLADVRVCPISPVLPCKLRRNKAFSGLMGQTLSGGVVIDAPELCSIAMQAGLRVAGFVDFVVTKYVENSRHFSRIQVGRNWERWGASHRIAVEHVGPATDGRCYSMRGNDITSNTQLLTQVFSKSEDLITIGIGDGGNEIGMGKIPHETIVKNIPNGDLIHCRVPTDHLIVAGVSNWGAYALAAGMFVLSERKPPPDLFDPDREHTILEAMVRDGPLVDGVTGKQTATVDGLTWDEYAQPLVEIRRILES